MEDRRKEQVVFYDFSVQNVRIGRNQIRKGLACHVKKFGFHPEDDEK